MAKYKTKAESVSAIQFTGNNWTTIQNIAGTRSLDAQGVYTLPNFDKSENWWPNNPDPEVTAVIFINSQWVGVKPNDWLVKDLDENVSICSDEDFQEKYELDS